MLAVSAFSLALGCQRSVPLCAAPRSPRMRFVRQTRPCSALSQPYLVGLNAEQTEVVTAPLLPLRVLAGPGSGKTRVLTARVAHLVHSNFRPDEILCITFTNKAATEMRARLDQLLGPSARGKYTAEQLQLTAHGLALHQALWWARSTPSPPGCCAATSGSCRV